MAITRVANTSFNSDAYGWAYAPNIIGLKGLTTEDKYVLQVWNSDESEKLADIRVDANQEGLAYIDISTILQSQVAPKKTQPVNFLIDGSPFANSATETAEIVIKWGSETDGVVTIDQQANGLKVSRQRNKYQYQASQNLNTFSAIGNPNPEVYNVTSSGSAYPSIPKGTLTGGCTSVNVIATTQTDWSYTKLGSQITDGKPYWVGEYSNIPVLMQKITRTRVGNFSYIPYRSISIYNKFEDLFLGSIAPYNGCEAVVITEYNGNTQLNDTIFYNTIANGGGPNTAVGDGAIIEYPYNYITFQIKNNINPGAFTFNSATTHFYVSFMVGTGAGCGDELYTRIHEQPAWLVTRYDVVEECNDYSPFTIMWLNSKGFYDYFQFNKKHEEQISVQRNPYQAGKFDYNRPDLAPQDYGTNKRGITNYSQKMVRQLTLTTGYLEDYEAEFLKNLIMSPEVYYIDQENFYKVDPSVQEHPIACQLVTNTYTEKTYRKNKLFQLEIKVQDSFNLNSQRA